MGLFTKRIGPVFLKETSDAELFVRQMELLQSRATGSLKDEISKQIKLAKYGISGERSIAYELKNSGMDMYILHDIYLESGDLNAQIDYLVITRKHIYVIECKNLFGNIEIDSSGNFIRSYELMGKRIKEGIYSPITQNQRHLQVLKNVRMGTKKNFLTRFLFEKDFDTTYKSIIVLANPKTFLNIKYAKKDVKKQVIRADQLISYLKETERSDSIPEFDTDTMLNLAQFYLNSSQPSKSDYAQKYENALQEVEQAPSQSLQPEPVPGKPSEDTLIKELKAFRLQQSRKEGIKPYYIFNDNQMKDLIQKAPTDKASLLQISGFGPVKVEKYGDAILDILKKAP